MTIEVTTAAYLLPAGETVAVTNQEGISYAPSQTAGYLTISGTLQVTLVQDGSGGSLAGGRTGIVTSGFQVRPSAKLLITSDGVVRVDATASDAHQAGGVQVNHGPDFLNNGLIEVKAQLATFGVTIVGMTADNPMSFLNAGTISAISTRGVATGLSTNAMSGLPLNTGSIEVFSGKAAQDAFDGVSAVGWVVGGRFGQNDGRIVAHKLAADATGYAVIVSGLRSDVTTFVNTGLLQGDVALKSRETVFQGDNVQNPAIIIRNAGEMIGQINLDNVPHLLTNSGSIVGATTFGSANDTYDGRAGREIGLVSGGEGADTLLGGAYFDNLQGNQGADSISGGGGDDIVVGGKDNDVQRGDSGDDIVWGNMGNDTLDGGGGADQVRGGQGDDSLSGGAGDDYMSGDMGSDTTIGGAGSDRFHTWGGAGLDRVLDFNAAEGDRVVLDPGTTYTAAQVGADTIINITGGAQMVLVGVTLSSLNTGWIYQG